MGCLTSLVVGILAVVVFKDIFFDLIDEFGVIFGVLVFIVGLSLLGKSK